MSESQGQDLREELLSLTARARGFAEAWRKSKPDAKVRSEHPFRLSKAFKEKELSLRLATAPEGIAQKSAAKLEVLRPLKVAFVSADPIKEGSPAGLLLQNIITKAMGLRLEDSAVYSLESLDLDLKAREAKSLVALGEKASQSLLKSDLSLKELRGRLQDYQGRPLVATHHPLELTKNEGLKRPVWEDIKMLVARLNELEKPGSPS